MKVRIYTTTKTRDGTRTQIDHHTYVASDPDDCRDNIDRFAYETAVEMGQTVTVGCVTAEIVTGEDDRPYIDDEGDIYDDSHGDHDPNYDY
jgi:hypothetical protein